MVVQNAMVVVLANHRTLGAPKEPKPSAIKTDAAGSTPGPAAGHATPGPLAGIQMTVMFDPQEPILWEGARADYLFRVVTGVVKVHRLLPNGHCQVFGFLFPGDLLGLTAQEFHSYSAIAVGLVTLSRFPRRTVDELAAASPQVARLLYSHASDALTAAQDQMLLLGRKTSSEKIASFLLAMALRAQSDAVSLPMTRVDIADYLGLAVETVSRTLTQFRQAGLLRVDKRSIHITNRAEIENLSNPH